MKLFEVFAEIGLNSTDFMSGLGRVNSAMDRAMGAITKAVTIAGGAIKGLALGATNVGMEFESSMGHVRAQTGMTDDDINKLQRGLRDMTREGVHSINTVGDAAASISMAGRDADDMLNIMNAAMVLADATGSDLTNTAENLGLALLKSGADSSYAEKYINSMAFAIRTSGMSMDSLMSAFLRAAPTLNATGDSAEFANATFAMLYRGGISATKAGAGLDYIFQGLTGNTIAAAEMMEELGISMFDAEGNTRPMYDVINDVMDALDGMATEQERVEATQALFNTTARQVFDELYNQRDAWRDTVAEMYNATAAVDGTGVAFEMAGKQVDDLAGDWANLKARVSELGVAFYDDISVNLREGTAVAKGYLKQLSDAFTEGGLKAAVGELGYILADAVTRIAEKAPLFVETGIALISSLALGLTENSEEIRTAGIATLETFFGGLRELLPKLLPLGNLSPSRILPPLLILPSPDNPPSSNTVLYNLSICFFDIAGFNPVYIYPL